jgi:hypothetical protein
MISECISACQQQTGPAAPPWCTRRCERREDKGKNLPNWCYGQTAPPPPPYQPYQPYRPYTQPYAPPQPQPWSGYGQRPYGYPYRGY